MQQAQRFSVIEVESAKFNNSSSIELLYFDFYHFAKRQTVDAITTKPTVKNKKNTERQF